MDKLRVQNWEESYARKENFIFYPKEEVVKFLNRFISKRVGVQQFIPLLESDAPLKGLDLGCGIGRQTILFKEFGIEAYGVDISSKALQQANELAHHFGYDLSDRFIQLNHIALPFSDHFFDFAISDSVLDSMEFNFAQRYLQELNRTVKTYLYLNLISGESIAEGFAGDVEVEEDHEKGTLQSYYSIDRIHQLIMNTDFKIVSLERVTHENLTKQRKRVRFHVVLKK